MAMTDTERLRALLGETIPVGGSASDTLFSEDQVDDLLTRHGSVEAAESEGWRQKAAALATLVDTTEGSSTRKHSAAHKAALAQVRTANTTAGGRGTRIHQIER
jgi:hypothetical protein